MGLLGYYEKSYKLMTLPISTLTNVLTPAIQPVLVKYQNERSVAYNVYLKFTDTLLLIGFALMPFLFFSSNECILLVFGSQWRDAIPVFSILSISVPFQLVDSISGSIFQSTNKVVYLLKSGFLCALINILFLVLGLILGGLQLVASFVTLSFILNFIISSYYINKLVFGKTLISYLTLCGKHIPVFITISLSLLIVNMFPLDIVSGFLIKLIISVSIFISYCRIRKIKLLDV